MKIFSTEKMNTFINSESDRTCYNFIYGFIWNLKNFCIPTYEIRGIGRYSRCRQPYNTCVNKKSVVYSALSEVKHWLNWMKFQHLMKLQQFLVTNFNFILVSSGLAPGLSGPLGNIILWAPFNPEGWYLPFELHCASLPTPFLRLLPPSVFPSCTWVLCCPH